jgi:hypothetical protein
MREVPRNLNTNCCDLGLTDQQEDDIVAFLGTLSVVILRRRWCRTVRPNDTLLSYRHRKILAVVEGVTHDLIGAKLGKSVGDFDRVIGLAFVGRLCFAPTRAKRAKLCSTVQAWTSMTVKAMGLPQR